MKSASPESQTSDDSPDCEKPKTVIRVPLCADEDEENGPGISFTDVMALFPTLKDEIAGYLLFLKSVTSIELRLVGNGCIARAEIPFASREYRYAATKALSDIVSLGIEESYDLYHQTQVVVTDAQNFKKTFRWSISQHITGSPAEVLLDRGAIRDPYQFLRALHPKATSNPTLVAVAALVSVDGEELKESVYHSFRGRIFEPLPSAFGPKLPVHIYGVFPPNRGLRLRFDVNAEVRSSDCLQQPQGSLALGVLIAYAWANLLLKLSFQNQSEGMMEPGCFRYWPSHAGGEFLESIHDYTLHVILSRNYPLWPTVIGPLPIQRIFMSRAIGVIQEVRKTHLVPWGRLHSALLQLKIPISYLPGGPHSYFVSARY